MKKRGQLTAFILIGLVILFGAGLFIYLQFFKVSEIQIEVPEQAAPVKEFVERCLTDVATDATVRAGLQGGYTQLPDEILGNPFRHLNLIGTFNIPYWYYNGGNDFPTLDEIGKQISAYTEQNVETCLNFAELEGYDITQLGDPKVSVSINAEDVDVYLNLPVEIKIGPETTRWDTYLVKLPVRLQKVYDTALEVLNSENRDLFLERVTVDLMVLDEDIPVSDLRFDTCKRLTWQKQAVINTLKDDLYYNIPRLRVNKTDYYPFPADDEFERVQFLIDAIENPDKNLHVNFRYQRDWPLEMYVRPIQGNTLVANRGKGFAQYLSFLCINFYHFTYDIRYPVEVTVKDDESFNGNGFLMRYVVPVQINHNQGDRSNFGTSEYYIPEIDDDDFCERTTDLDYSIRAVDPTFDEEQEVNISFECLVFKCDLGRTSVNERTLHIDVETKLPDSCSAGVLVAEEEYDPDLRIGYLESSTEVDFPLIDREIEIPLKAYKTYGIEVTKFIRGSLDEPIAINEDDEVLITIENIDKEFYEAYSYSLEEPNEQVKLLLENEVTYDVNLMVTVDEEYKGGWSGKWTARYNDIADADKIVFNAIVDESIGTDEQLIDLVTYIEDNSAALKPIELK